MKDNIVILDLTDCKYIGEIHQRIKETFGFPDYYGENWHAFKDAFITVGVPDKIKVKGTSCVPSRLIGEVDKMLSTLESMKQELASYGFNFEFEVID